MALKFIKENDFLKSMNMNRKINDDDESPERHSSSRKDKRYKLDRQANYIQQSRGTPPREGYVEQRKNDRKPKAKREPKPEPEWTPLNRPRPIFCMKLKVSRSIIRRNLYLHLLRIGPGTNIVAITKIMVIPRKTISLLKCS